MGDAADSALEYAMNHGIGFGWGGKLRRRSYQSGSGAGQWRTAQGVVLKMSEMTEDHIRNALALCESRGNTAKAADFRKELKHRGLEA